MTENKIIYPPLAEPTGDVRRVKKLKLTFVGGVTTVTGANFLLENLPEGDEQKVRILIDCGLEQGDIGAYDHNHTTFSYDPSSIDYLFITHAHMDHLGLVPKLVKDGFNGKIFSTPETKALAPIMYEDAVKIFTYNFEKLGEKMIYETSDALKALSMWHEIPYHSNTSLKGGFNIYAKDAGHILGSAMYEITYNGTKIVFTGDLGNNPSPIIRDAEDVIGATYMVMESVYGDRNHESQDERLSKLEDVIEDAFKNKGALIIPCFSLEKTQVILYEMNKLFEEARVPEMPVFLDSPLAIKITEVYEKMSKNFNNDARKDIQKEGDIFNFPKLTLIRSSEESKKLLEVKNPKIIIAGSGMSNGGRILHHEANYLPDPKSTLLLIGYQSVGTLGRRIQSGEKKVSIYGSHVPVRAKVVTIDGYSSHKDSEHLLEFVSKGRDTLKKVFPVMGEPKASLFLAQRIQDYLGLDAYHPEEGESIVLEF